MNNNPICIVLIGLPCSGKSTFRERLVEQYRAAGREFCIISSDDYIEQYAREYKLTYSQAFAELDFKTVTKAVSKDIAEAVAAGWDIIVDRTNMSKRSRHKVLARLSKDYRKVAFDFQVDRVTIDARLKARAEATGKHVPADSIDQMIAQYEKPDMTEFDEIVVR